jgi:hypothetical protein
MSSTTTQIVTFVTQEEVDFKSFSDAAKAGATGLESQAMGDGVLELNAKCWFLGNFVSNSMGLS